MHISPSLFQHTTSTNAATVTAATSTTATSSTSAPYGRSHLPIWLSMPKSHLMEYNLEQLQSALRDSYFTENEALKLLFAIQEAAGGDRHKTAGAAEFCLMLVETMELGLHALVAAAFHYCSCVTAREQQSTVLSERFHMASFGEHVVHIARDAARLKELEMVAARVVQKEADHSADEEQYAKNLLQLLLSESKDWRALAIRSAACLYRLRGLLEDAASLAADTMDSEKLRVAREALWIYAPIASRLGMHRLKNELEGAAFQILYREEYEQLTAATMERENHDDSNGPTVQESMNRVLEYVQDDVTTMLQQDEQFSSLTGGDFTVTARVKEPYSMWRKMKSHGYQHIWQVPDALALRIVLNAAPLSDEEPVESIRARERALCYYAQQLCTERYKPQPNDPRFKDYIDKPKPNGYQSLHYTAQTELGNDIGGGRDWSLEIQVRSGEMHQVAEFGLASHWEYKAQSNNKAPSSSSTASAATTTTTSSADVTADKKPMADTYLRKVQQWHWEQQGGAPSLINKRTTNNNNNNKDINMFPRDDTAQTASQVSVDPWLEANDLDDLWQSRVLADRIRARTRLQPYIEALASAQSSLTRDFVFVFLESQGTVLSLPAGACVVDALRQSGCNGDGGNTGGWGRTNLNGRQVTAVNKRLCNGDVLTTELPLTTTTKAQPQLQA